MNFRELITREAVLPELGASNKTDALKELAEVLCTAYPEIDQGEVVKILLERERLGSTGLEDGVAIPHGKLKGLRKVAAVFGRSSKGVDFESMDEKPSHIFFLLMAPENSAGSHLKALARIVRATKEEAFRDSLMGAGDAGEMYEILLREDERA